jgi:hypothetical protein
VAGQKALVSDLVQRGFHHIAAHRRLLPVASGLAALLPEPGIRRGSTVAAVGSTSLALALGAEASRSGAWCAAVGARSLGVLAASELGYDMARFAVISVRETLACSRATAALMDACDVVLVWPAPGMKLRAAENLSALARERGAVLIVAGGARAWPGRVDLTLSLVRSSWIGIESGGAGRLRARRADVGVSGRGAASMGRRGSLWLPDERGAITPVLEPAEPLRAVQ